jgi:hypothetical protein
VAGYFKAEPFSLRSTQKGSLIPTTDGIGRFWELGRAAKY